MNAGRYYKGDKILIKRILIAYDGTDLAKRAFDLASDIATKYSAEIMILNVIPRIPKARTLVIPSTPPMIVPMYPAITKQEILKMHENILSEALDKAKKNYPKLKIVTKMVEGNSSNKIVEVAEVENFDLIVMGTRGTHGFNRFIHGSVSDSVKNNARVSVLLVK